MRKIPIQILVTNVVLCGPFIEDGRWIVEVPRKYTDAASLFSGEALRRRKKRWRRRIGCEINSDGFQRIFGKEISKVYTENSDFAEFLTDFLSGKPFWLKAIV